MSKELVISANRHETKVAVVEDDQLVEVYFQRANEYSLAGSIHKGRVTRVLPGMQSAFVDVGLDRDTFLYVSDFFEENEEIDHLPALGEEPVSRSMRNEPRYAEPRVESDRPGNGRTVFEGAGSAPALEKTETPFSGTPLAEPATGFAAENTVTRPAQGPRREEGDGREQRGRRSRRRRSRGGGFPDSKYASEGTGPTAAPITSSLANPVTSYVSREPEPQHADEQGIAHDVIVLPGESLAKYRGVQRNPPAEVRTREERTFVPLAAEESEPVEERAAKTESFHEIEIHSTPVQTPAVDALVAEPGVGPGIFMTHKAQESEKAAAEIEHIPLADASGSEMPFHDGEETLVESYRVEHATSADEEHATSADEDREIPQQLILNPLENDEVRSEAAEQSPGATVETAGLSANVREQGSRYMHRVPRRMRRKSRGGNASESREHGDRLKEQGDRPREDVSHREPQAEPMVREEQQPAIERPERSMPSIAELLKEGQEIIVQIAKEPLGQKGARITSHIALPGRYVVYMPTLEHFGVSRKIASDAERMRLKRILQANRQGITGGCIVRTAGEGQSAEDIAADMTFLFNLWLDIRQKAEKKPAPLLLHHDLEIVQRILRDQVTDNFKAVWVDNEELYESVLRFVQRFQPALVTRVKMYTRPEPIFDAFNVTAELEKALRPKVWLKSGGYIVINQTEALVAIDVNTGKFVGKSNRLEDTIVKTNTEAVKEIVRQMRLRDLGGIIVVDFIDMDERKNRQKVMQTLDEAMRSDRAPYKVLQFNDFGLVAITRKRVKQSLERTLCSPCPYCEGAGYVKSVQTIIGEILQEAPKLSPAIEGKDVMLRVHPEVAKILKSNSNRYLEELEELLGRPVMVKSDPAIHHEKFDLG